MRLLTKITVVVSLMVSLNTNGQVVVKQLFSKMDVFPQHQLWDGNTTMLMGFTELLGAPIGLPSPTLVFNEGDSVELKLRNFSQPAPHTIHLHGLDVDQQNDGVPHLSFYVDHDSTKSYYFVAPHAGTYLYHCHVFSTLHVQAGMYGLIIVKPPSGSDSTWSGGYAYDNEYAWLTSEIDTVWHHDTIINETYDSTMMQHQILDYNPQYFLVNGKSEQQLNDPDVMINAAANEVVYLRLANIGYMGNRVILPSGLNAKIIASDGRPLPTEIVSDTIELMPGERYGVLLNPTSEFTSTAQIEYFDLNTQVVWNTQDVPVEVSGFMNIQTIENGDNIIVYPNPSDDQFYVDASQLESTIGSIDIVNASGQLIETLNKPLTSLIKIDSEKWSNGIYFLRIKTNQTIITKRIIKH